VGSFSGLGVAVVGEQDPTETGSLWRIRGGATRSAGITEEPAFAGPGRGDKAAAPVPEQRLLQGRFPQRVRLGDPGSARTT
jgi:hypothetical protein